MPGLSILLAAIGPLGAALVALALMAGLILASLALMDAGRDSFR